MNFYTTPNYYPTNYSPYNNQYPLPASQVVPTYPITSSGVPNQPTLPPQPQPQPQAPLQQNYNLNGKFVDSEDVARVTEVPIGGYGIFPKADLSEIYVKTWNRDGKADVIPYKPVLQSPTMIHKDNGELINLLIQKIDMLEGKVDKLLNSPMESVQQIPPMQAVQQQQQPKKVEVAKNNGF